LSLTKPVQAETEHERINEALCELIENASEHRRKWQPAAAVEPKRTHIDHASPQHLVEHELLLAIAEQNLRDRRERAPRV
jgi:hypothetical protein